MNVAEQAYQQMQTLPPSVQVEALRYIELLKQNVSTNTLPKINVITAKQAKLPDINDPIETNQAFIKHLLAIPKAEDDEDIFARESVTMRDIDLVD